MKTLFQVLGLLALAALSTLAEKRRYDGYKLYNVFPVTKSQTEFITEMSADVDLSFFYEGVDRFDILVPPAKQDDFLFQLGRKDIRFDIAEHNLQDVLDMEEEEMKLRKVEPGRAVDYNNWNTYDNIMAELRILASRCPPGSSCEVQTIGQSHLGRNIDALRIFRNGANRRTVWVDATIHAREWLATSTILHFMKHMIDDFQDPTVSDFLGRFDFYFIPVMNPDGYAYSHTNDRMWRKNRRPNAGSTCVGTDLNRNYDQMYANAGTSTNPCSETFRGPSAASEPETIVTQAALRNRASSLLFSMHLHTYGQLWLIPWGSVTTSGACNMANDHSAMMVHANVAANAVQATYGTTWQRGNSCATIYPASGITMDYSKGVGGVGFTVTPELRGNNFSVAVSQIPLAYNETWNGFAATVRSTHQEIDSL